MIGFLFLSLLTGVLELGSVFYAWGNGFPAAAILAFSLPYQLGNLLFLPGIVTGKEAFAAGMCGMGLLAAYAVSGSHQLLGGGVLAASLCLQAARSAHKGECPSWVKRSFRVAGFLLSPCVLFFPGISVGICLAASFLALGKPGRARLAPKPKAHAFQVSPVMVFHQMHYFVYAYMMPICIAETVSRLAVGGGRMAGDLAGSIAGGLLFALSWVVYIQPQKLSEQCRDIPYRRWFFLGHGFLAVVMGALGAACAAGNLAWMAVLWLATGLGGGTVFCISRLTEGSRQMDLSFSENLGHVLGPLAAVLLAYTLPGSEEAVLCAASCCFVCLTLLSALWITRKEGDYEKT